MFDECEFGAGLELTKVDLIHERPNEEDAATGAAEEILRSERVREMFPVDAFSLIGDGEDERFAIVLKTGCDLFSRVVVIAMQDGIDGGLADGHGDAEALFFVDTGLRGEFLRGSFDLTDALHGGGKRKAQFSGFRIGHRRRLRLYREWQSPALPREEVIRLWHCEKDAIEGSFMVEGDCVKNCFYLEKVGVG